jgi:hypothetical protein
MYPSCVRQLLIRDNRACLAKEVESASRCNVQVASKKTGARSILMCYSQICGYIAILQHSFHHTPIAASHLPPLPPLPLPPGAANMEGISGFADAADAFRFRADAWTTYERISTVAEDWSGGRAYHRRISR